MSITLTRLEMLIAHQVGAMRYVANRKLGAKQKYGAEEGLTAEMFDIIAARGEMAVAKHFNLYWSGIGKVAEYSSIDVGWMIDVRACNRPTDRLILHDEDTDDRPYVLACVTFDKVDLIGWMYAGNGKRRGWWCDPTHRGRWAYFVPRRALQSIEALGEIIL